MNKKRQYLVKDPNKVDEGAKAKILFEELNGEPLINAILYWCIANNIYMDIENKAIEDKISELNTLLNE